MDPLMDPRLLQKHLSGLIAAEKTLAVVPKWVEHQDQLRYVTSLEIGGVAQEGIRLRGQCRREYQDHNVTFQIEHLFKQSGRFVPVIRLDWRPQEPHQNRNMGPLEWRLIRIDGSHLHPLDANMNWMVEEAMTATEFAHAQRNLPIAAPLEDDPATFAELLALVGRCFGIAGTETIPTPPWSRRLL